MNQINYNKASVQIKTQSVELAKSIALNALKDLANALSHEYSDDIEAETKRTLLFQTFAKVSNLVLKDIE